MTIFRGQWSSWMRHTVSRTLKRSAPSVWRVSRPRRPSSLAIGRRNATLGTLAWEEKLSPLLPFHVLKADTPYRPLLELLLKLRPRRASRTSLQVLRVFANPHNRHQVLVFSQFTTVLNATTLARSVITATKDGLTRSSTSIFLNPTDYD